MNTNFQSHCTWIQKGIFNKEDFYSIFLFEYQMEFDFERKLTNIVQMNHQVTEWIITKISKWLMQMISENVNVNVLMFLFLELFLDFSLKIRVTNRISSHSKMFRLISWEEIKKFWLMQTMFCIRFRCSLIIWMTLKL